ncbi:MAG: thermonuclease family protein [Rhodospirillaceae bacterium]
MRTLIFLLCLSFGPAWAEGLPPVVGQGRVEGVEPGGILRLEDGRRVRLAVLEGRAEVRDAVAPLVVGHAVALHWPTEQHDRHGRLVAHVVRADGLWLQRVLVGDGAARVVTFPDERAAAASLLEVEASARNAGRGIWATSPLLPAADVAAVDKAKGQLAVIEGTVVSAAVVRGRLYLNFGQDWRRDVTVSISAAGLRTFPKPARAAEYWQGQPIRARGWVRRYNGPLIEVDHPEALERLGGK